jgi:homocysteine S-methyltransferase
MATFLEKLRTEILVGDGAIGTLLIERGAPNGVCTEDYNRSHPDMVRQLHADYIAAGAQVIETNTWGANPWKLKYYALEDKVAAINLAGVQRAREAVAASGKKEIFIAGAVGPISVPNQEAPPQSERDGILRAQISTLLDAGVDVLFLETYSDLDDLLLGLRIAKQLDKTRPVLTSMSFTEDGFTYGGGVSVVDAFRQLRAAGADVVGVNCLNGPHGTLQIIRRVPLEDGLLLSAYPNSGRPQFFNQRFVFHTSPEYLGDTARQLVEEGVRLVGSCCGTNPAHTAAIARAVRGMRPVTTKHVVSITPRDRRPQAVEIVGDTLLDLVKKKTVVVTELDPPRNMDYEKIIAGAKALKEAGTDFMTLADNSLAILRMSNIALGHMVQQQADLPCIVHVSCRDRNSIGTQSELMGMAALGLHHVLAITGDPARFGDVPEASSVYDLNSISLIGAICRMNSGQTLTGRPLKYRTRFIIGCSFNPNVQNMDGQVKRLERKLAAGAQFVMTQPIYDPALAKATAVATKQFGVPVLVGVMPLLNSRNTQFLANEVPGIEIPQQIQDRMRGKEGDDGKQEGVAIAREMAESVLEHFQAIYLITPLARYDTTVELSQWVREKTKR